MSQDSSSSMKGCVIAVFGLGALGVVAAAGGYAFWNARVADRTGPAAVAPTVEPLPAPVAEAPTPAVPTSAAGAAIERIRARGRLLVGMDTGEPPGAGTPPMYFLDSQGGRDGFDYALSRRVADGIGVREVEIVHAKYSELEGLLADESPRVDIVISGYSPTEAAGLAWSDPYLEYGLCLVVKSGSEVRSTADLFGKPVGIFDDDAAAADVQRLVKGYTELVRMEDGYWDALATGRFAGFLYDYPYAVAELAQWTAADPAHRGKLKIAQYNLTDSTYAVGVRAAEGDLLGSVNTSIAAWRASDDYAAAIRRYLKGGEAAPVEVSAARTVVVRKGDTLSGIAQRELGGVDRWPELWELNRSRFPNPHLIEVGDTVILP